MNETPSTAVALPPQPPAADLTAHAAPAADLSAHAAPVAAPHCANCGMPVSSRFCGHCGQRLQEPVHSVWHFLREATEDLTHADSRLWRTLAALLFRPGYLTREFLDGRRARYLPPVRLYLVMSVIFFLVAGLPHPHQKALQLSVDRGTPHATVFDVRNPQDAQRLCESMAYEGPWKTRIGPALKSACYRTAADQGRTLQEQFLHNIPRAMFVFLPLLALCMRLMYWRPRRYYLEHLLFFVHDHAAAFLILTLFVLVRSLGPPAPLSRTVNVLVGVYLPLYLYQSMRRVYGQGPVLTSAKFLALACAYLLTSAVMLAAVAVYSFLMV